VAPDLPGPGLLQSCADAEVSLLLSVARSPGSVRGSPDGDPGRARLAQPAARPPRNIQPPTAGDSAAGCGDLLDDPAVHQLRRPAWTALGTERQSQLPCLEATALIIHTKAWPNGLGRRRLGRFEFATSHVPVTAKARRAQPLVAKSHHRSLRHHMDVLDTIFGLPVHALVVHATVVVVPTTAAAVLVSALWPRFRRWASWGPLALAVLSVILDPISTQSGEALEHRLPRTQLVQDHAHLADGLLPWVIGLFVGSVALYWRGRRVQRGDPVGAEAPRWIGWLVTVVCVAAALGTLVEVVLIGHSGAVAAWSGVGA
jgi:hypothetical protein